MQSVSFSELGLSTDLLKAVKEMGFEEASPIQAATIPALLSGKDVAGLSRTGSGKTAAFAIPAVECVEASLGAPQVLILCPTRELAVQVAGEVAKLSAFKRGVKELAIYGGASYGTQYRGLENGAQVIAGTPGRIMDHLDRGSLRLDAIKMVILDEADRMLDMGFRDDIATILQQAPPTRQTAFFSATMPPAVEQLIKRYTSDPFWVRLETRAEAAPNIDQCYFEVGHGSRVGALCRVLEATNMRFGIIFCSTKNAVDGVTEHLVAEGYQADRLHGDMSQAMRERVMRRFRDRKLEFLVATDVAARGIDVDDVEVVLNYDLPRDPEDYVHRIGRTGRAGRSGRAISFVTPREMFALDRIFRLTRIKIRRERMPTPAEAAQKRLDVLVQTARDLIATGTVSKAHTGAKSLLSDGTQPEIVIEALLHLLTHRKAAGAKAHGEKSENESHADVVPGGGPRAPKYADSGDRFRSDSRRNYRRESSSEGSGSGAASGHGVASAHADERRPHVRREYATRPERAAVGKSAFKSERPAKEAYERPARAPRRGAR